MISIIVLLILVHEAIKIYKAKQYTKQIENQRQYKTPAVSEKELNRIRIAKEKAIKQAEKERKQAEENQRKKNQTEADIIFFESQYEILYELARQVEADIQELTKQIKIDKLTHSYDRVKTKENKLYQLTKKQVSIESQLYSMQCRINKAKHIIKAG